MIEKELSQYQHRTISANFARMDRLLAGKGQFCAMGTSKAENVKNDRYYTLPDLFTFTVVMFMHESLYAKLGSPTRYSLNKLLEAEKYTLGIPKGRNFSPILENILRKRKGRYIRYLANSAISEGTMKLILKKRGIDLAIEYPIEGRYAVRDEEDRGKLKSVIISEDSEPIYSWTSCTKTPWGIKVVNQINKALLKIRPSDEYRHVYEKLIDEKLVPEYRRLYDSIFLKAK